MSGEITLSIELELGWGSHMSSTYDRYSAGRKEESKYLHKLLDLCDKYEIPITFNVVGALFANDDISETSVDSYPDGWWDEYRTADENVTKLFHAPDLVQAILDADVDHEIATHTLSHIMIDEVSNDCFEYELDTVQQIHSEWGIEQPSSFVAPRHRQFNPKTVSEHDISVVRVPDSDQSTPGISTSVWILRRKHPVKKPEVVDGLVNTYSSSYPSLTYSGVLPKGQLEADTHFQYLPLKIRQRFQQRYLRDAVQRAKNQDSNAHLWTHLWDMSNNEQWQPIETFIPWLNEQAASDDVDILRMGELAERASVSEGESGDGYS
jgi:peptidoglycan/xylan/chitin deacetylase (PgdA/CDA1 family)